MSATAGLIQIRGRGPVALACALFLVRRGIPAGRIALGADRVLPAPPPEGLARRTIALAQGSHQLLERIVTVPPAGRIERVEVSIQHHAGRTRIQAQDLKLPALGHVLPYAALLAALHRACAPLPWAPVDAEVTEPTVIIHADGAPGAAADARDFDQSAVLAEVRSTGTVPAALHCAFERFTPNGPLALLPLPTLHRWSLVWCDRPEHSAARAALCPEAFNAALMAHFGPSLGPLALDSPCQTVVLQRLARRQITRGHEVWIGNAAQSLHPVAGQGLNLGLRDAFELADALAGADRRAQPLPAALPRWARQRAPDRWLTLTLTDLMAASFTWPGAPWLQSPVLAALDLMPTLRAPLARQLAFGRRRAA